MEDSYVNSVFKAYFKSYRFRNLETKEINQSSCEDGILWAWLIFGECLVSPAHKIGYLVGALSLLFWIVGCLMECSQIESKHCLGNLLIVSFVVNIVSFAGAVMSLQIMFVISYDVLTVAVTMVVMVAVVVKVLMRRSSGNYKYKPVCNNQDHAVTSPPQQLPLGQASSKACAIPMCLGFMSILSVTFVSVTSTNILKEVSSSAPAAFMGLQHQVLLSIVGYVLGCFACFGRWSIEIVIVSRFLKEIHANRLWKGGGVMLMISDVLYILGVLLQSGSFRVTLVTLPWLVGRAVQCCFQMYILTMSKLLHQRPPPKKARGNDDNDTEKNVDDLELTTLLRSSDSDSCDMHVLFDCSWNLQEIPSVQSLPKQSTAPMLPQTHTFAAVDDVTTTTDSDVSSSSQEHELTWKDDITTLKFSPSIDLTTLSSLRQQRLSLTSQIETLSRTSSETSDQRVRSWISQSTPEEETPSCLTLTLNLDTPQDSVHSMAHENVVNRKFSFCSAFPLSPRKNSF